MPEPLPSPRPTPWPVPAPPPSPGPWVGSGAGGASRSTPGVVWASAGAEAIGATMVAASSGSRGFSMGAGGGSSRAGSGLFSEWSPSRWTLGAGAFCRRPPPPPPPPGSGQREVDESRSARGRPPRRAARRREATSRGWQSTAIASAASPWRPVETSTGTPLGRGTSGATATIAPRPGADGRAAGQGLDAGDGRLAGDQRLQRQRAPARRSAGCRGPPGRARRVGETRAAAAISASENTSSSGTASMAAGIPSQNACRIGGRARPGSESPRCRRIAGDFPVRPRRGRPAGSRSAVRGAGTARVLPSVPPDRRAAPSPPYTPAA